MLSKKYIASSLQKCFFPCHLEAFLNYLFTSTRTPLKFWLIVTLPSFTQKSPISNLGPFDSIFVCFLLVYMLADIFIIKRSNRPSAINGTTLLPDSKRAKTEAGCSELWSTWTVLWAPGTRILFFLHQQNSQAQIIKKPI